MLELRPVLGRRAHDLRGVVYEVRYREKPFAAAELVPAGPAYGAGFTEQAVYPLFGLRLRFEQRERLLRFAAPFSERTPEKRFDGRFYLSARSGLQRHVEQPLAEFCEGFAVAGPDGVRSPFFAEVREPPLRVVRFLAAVEQPLRGERGENFAHPLLVYLCAQWGHRRGGGLERRAVAAPQFVRALSSAVELLSAAARRVRERLGRQRVERVDEVRRAEQLACARSPLFRQRGGDFAERCGGERGCELLPPYLLLRRGHYRGGGVYVEREPRLAYQLHREGVYRRDVGVVHVLDALAEVRQLVGIGVVPRG